jgi:hypothetical protein
VDNFSLLPPTQDRRHKQLFFWFILNDGPRPPRGGQLGLSALRVSHNEPVLYGVFVWARRALTSQKRRFPARAVDEAGNPTRFYPSRARGDEPVAEGEDADADGAIRPHPGLVRSRRPCSEAGCNGSGWFSAGFRICPGPRPKGS